MYNNLSTYLKTKYGMRIGKICIDGGFGCPNRDGTCGYGGCSYCGERGAGEHIDYRLSIAEQVKSGLARGKSDGYIAYFQSFTNTYAPLPVLRERYDSALIDDRIRILAIGTRPDCIDESVAELLAEYKERLDLWVELGLQSASDETARRINRGYKTEVYRRCTELLHRYDIPFVTHAILGLPGEGEEDYDRTVDEINRAHGFGVKLHSLYVSRGTALEGEYLRGEFTPISDTEYIRSAARAIARLRPDMIIHRITGDCPAGMLVAPEWNKDKNRIISEIRKTLSESGLKQGSLYTPEK